MRDLIYPSLIVILGIIAFCDIYKRKIPNILSGMLFLSGLLVLVLSYFFIENFWIISHLYSFISICIISIIFWKFKIWGGGDAKVMIGLSLFFPITEIFSVFLWIMISGGILSIFYLISYTLQKKNLKKITIPYGVAIFMGTLMVFINAK